MTTKKFSMAAAMAVGLISLSMTTTMAACPCGQHQNLSACPEKNPCSHEFVGCDNNITKSDMKQVYNSCFNQLITTPVNGRWLQSFLFPFND